MSVLIQGVSPTSVSYAMGLEPGDRLLQVNGRQVRDRLDFLFYASGEEELSLLVEKACGEVWEVEIERIPGEDLGLTLEEIRPRRCTCKCIFCFVDQLPPGMRPSLYLKDDDYRLSFLHGNYITLTNLRDEDWSRIREQRLSPLYVSLHATDPQVRAYMMGTPEAASGFQDLQRLVSIGIEVHLQVVICPGINDGEVFYRTVYDVMELYPSVRSIAVVPVGVTRHRRGLPSITPVTERYAKSFINRALLLQNEVCAKIGSPFFYLSDEWYIKARVSFPILDHYGDLAQLEDGVGMVPFFLYKWKSLSFPVYHQVKNPLLFVTGEAFAPFLRECLSASPIGGRSIVIPVKNRLFGPHVTVAGLLSGGDIIEALSGAPPGDVVLPSVLLNDDGLFLDDLSPEDVADALGRCIKIIEPTPQGVLNLLLEAPSSKVPGPIRV